jgi:hypothetical protein
MLKSEGFNVYTTDLGEEGVDLGKLHDYTIIFLHIIMHCYRNSAVLILMFVMLSPDCKKLLL